MKKIFLLATDSGFIRNFDTSIDKTLYQIVRPAVNVQSFYSYQCQFVPDICIIHSSYLEGSFQLLDSLVSNKKCIIIYCSNKMEYGSIYNLMDAVNFYFLMDDRMSGINEILEIMERDLRLFTAVDKRLHDYKDKINEERLVKRAKLALMETGYSEEDAYSYILKKAMDERASKGSVAKSIIESLKE